MALNFSDVKQISIVDYLATLGCHPHLIRGNNYWYHSPFRNETQPSFKVNERLNVWYDHGIGEGGTILDLGAKLYQCSIHDFARRLLVGAPTKSFSYPANSQKPSENKILILEARTLDSPLLISYLQSRGIENSLASQFCSEVDFEIGGRKFTAVGFQNRSGGWELRNESLKLSSSPKDISYLNNGTGKLCIMEGFMDFLSALMLKDTNFKRYTTDSSFLIINSVSFIKRGLEVIKGHDKVITCLDNDDAGVKALNALAAEGVMFQNASVLYSAHKDLNDLLMGKEGRTTTLPRSKGLGL